MQTTSMKLLTTPAESAMLINESHFVRQALLLGLSSTMIELQLKRLDPVSVECDQRRPDDMSWDEYIGACDDALKQDLMRGSAVVKWWEHNAFSGATHVFPVIIPVNQETDDLGLRKALCAAFLVSLATQNMTFQQQAEQQILLTPQTATYRDSTPGYLTVQKGISEPDQLDTVQNATLHGVTDNIAASLEIYPKYPAHIKTEGEAVAYLFEKLAPLASEGWNIGVHIGPEIDSDEESG